MYSGKVLGLIMSGRMAAYKRGPVVWQDMSQILPHNWLIDDEIPHG